jgi:RNA polymerase sigma-70 factor (ECF subfamily)
MRKPLGADPPGLLARLRAGDPRAFEELVTTYQHRVFGVALRMLGSRAEAEEIAQEAFLRAHRSVVSFRGDARLGTWLYGIASRLCLNRLSSPDRRMARGDAALADVPATTRDAAAEVERAELDAALRTAIEELPNEQRLVLVLRDVEGLSYEEIADALALVPGTVRSRLHRARMQLKEKLERFA